MSPFEAPNTFQPPSFQPAPQPDEALIRAAALAQAQNQLQSQVQQARGQQSRTQNHSSQSQAQVQVQQQVQAQNQVMLDHNDMQIDPSLLLAAANDPSLMARGMQNQYSDQQYADQQYTAQAAQAAFPPSPSSIAVYFRLHPASEVQSPARLWVSTLSSVNLNELRQLACVKFPGTIAFRVEGVIKQQGQPNGPEMLLPIDSDEELEAYFNAIAGVKPVFSVHLVSAWKSN